MSNDLLSDIAHAVNTGWGNQYQARLETRISYIEEKDSEGNVKMVAQHTPNGTLFVEQHCPHNKDYRRAVIVTRGTFPDFNADHLSVVIIFDQGRVRSTSERVHQRINSFVQDRLKHLNAAVQHLDRHDHSHPITWTPLVFSDKDGRTSEYHIHGSAEVGLESFECTTDGLQDLARLFVSAFNLVEHPNDYDDYLYLNNQGYINDTWSKVA